MGRETAIARLRARLLRLEQPRLLMALIVAMTGAAGFLTSAGLLQLGLRRMWLRYGLALVTAYLCFLLFVWLWVLYRRRELRDDTRDSSTAMRRTHAAAHEASRGTARGTRRTSPSASTATKACSRRRAADRRRG